MPKQKRWKTERIAEKNWTKVCKIFVFICFFVDISNLQPFALVARNCFIQNKTKKSLFSMQKTGQIVSIDKDLNTLISRLKGR